MSYASPAALRRRPSPDDRQLQHSGGLALYRLPTGYSKAEPGQYSPRRRERRAPRALSGRFLVEAVECSAVDLMEGGLLVVYGDVRFGPSIVRALLAAPDPLVVAVHMRWRELWKRRMGDPLGDTETMKIGASDHIIEFGKKPRGYDAIDGQCGGLTRVDASVVERRRRFYGSLARPRVYDGNAFEGMFMTSFIRCIINDRMPVSAVRFDGGRTEIDSIENLAAAATRRNSTGCVALHRASES